MSAVVKKLVIASTVQQYNVWLGDKNPKEYPLIRSERALRGWSRDMPILTLYPNLRESDVSRDAYRELCADARAMYENVRVANT